MQGLRLTFHVQGCNTRAAEITTGDQGEKARCLCLMIFNVGRGFLDSVVVQDALHDFIANNKLGSPVQVRVVHGNRVNQASGSRACSILRFGDSKGTVVQQT